MLGFLRGPILGILILLLLIINTVFWGIPAHVLAIGKLIPPARKFFTRGVSWCCETWVLWNVKMVHALLPTDWTIEYPANLNRQKSYLVSCNHQTWTDVMAIYMGIAGKVAFTKVFLKDQLRWVPILGTAWMALDYPFMKRYTPAQIAKNPKLKGQDIVRTREACERYRGEAVTILSFVEGTRRTPAKHAQQQSPYQHLLKPKAGGFAFVLDAMGDQINDVLDVTLVYHDGVKNMWQFLCGKVNKVSVIIRHLPLPLSLQNTQNLDSNQVRNEVQIWLSEQWKIKDDLISARLNNNS